MESWVKILGIIGCILLVVLLIVGGTCYACYNALVEDDVTCEEKLGNINSALQRRADLIPNLVETVKGSANFEKSTQTEIAEMRSQAGQIQVNAQNAQSIEEMQQVEGEISGLLSRLMVVVEAYPDLKSNENFMDLQSQLEGTENRIKYERDEYNEAVGQYKQAVRKFPSNIVAGMFGFHLDKWEMFAAQQGAEEAPVVDFS